MDIGTLKVIGTLLAMTAFAGVCWWAFSPHNRTRFDEAANFPIDEDQRTSPEKKQ